VTPRELRDALAELAREAGLDVRVLTASAEPELGLRAASGTCRVRGRLWVVLAAADPIEEHVAVLASALQRHAGAWLEGRWLPPAVRERLERVEPKP
jgi:hypothetical protein